MNALSVNQAASTLGVTPDEVMDASGVTLGELEHAAELAGLDAYQYRQVPALTTHDLEVIAGRLDRVNIDCAACGRNLGTVSRKPPVPAKCFACRTTK
ncbi:hypothetical protein JOJ86_001484 [Rhodococcus percolatus]|uniref:hypothetical protein n=1 Tax=Rhodococcus opacus TaxID=37919 RepID=UPI0015F92CBD|nr:hypothetical protein [Rhodococcus opacus]MBA8958193.1 hypothetical protein [Rhodococcus opacus]MBP2203758.1 hypothetical protein [Rhodococcus opacus]